MFRKKMLKSLILILFLTILFLINSCSCSSDSGSDNKTLRTKRILDSIYNNEVFLFKHYEKISEDIPNHPPFNSYRNEQKKRIELCEKLLEKYELKVKWPRKRVKSVKTLKEAFSQSWSYEEQTVNQYTKFKDSDIDSLVKGLLESYLRSSRGRVKMLSSYKQGAKNAYNPK